MSRIIRLLIVALAFYIGTYIGFRQTHIEVWERDKQAYVIFRRAMAGRSTICGVP